jgi:AraC-like DNA-binding protein
MNGAPSMGYNTTIPGGVAPPGLSVGPYPIAKAVPRRTFAAMTTIPVRLPNLLSPLPSRDLFAASWEGLARSSAYCRHRIAKKFPISVRTLDRHFQKHFSISVHQWLVELRLVDAHAQVLAGKSLKEISFDAGFKHRSHFTRSFKGRFGVVPSLLAPALHPFPSQLLTRHLPATRLPEVVLSPLPPSKAPAPARTLPDLHPET